MPFNSRVMPTLAFVANKHNLNSIAALTGALEADARASTLPLQLLQVSL